jgi:hypothetical protein
MCTTPEPAKSMKPVPRKRSLRRGLNTPWSFQHQCITSGVMIPVSSTACTPGGVRFCQQHRLYPRRRQVLSAAPPVPQEASGFVSSTACTPGGVRFCQQHRLYPRRRQVLSAAPPVPTGGVRFCQQHRLYPQEASGFISFCRDRFPPYRLLTPTLFGI